MSDNNDLEVYVYQEDNEGEEVPESVEKLIVNEGVDILPDELCCDFDRLQEVSLPNGLLMINKSAFRGCTNLLEISICNTVRCIGPKAFEDCELLSKVEFEMSTSSPQYQLEKIEYRAFASCNSVPRIKIPPSVTFVGRDAFHQCRALIEANLSTATGVIHISVDAFAKCYSLQTVSLPNTLKRICDGAFSECFELGTVVAPVDSQSIRIGELSFYECSRLANFVLPKGSTAKENCFFGCDLLQERYKTTGTPPYDSQTIVAGLMRRFDDLVIHRMCYDHLGITVEQLWKCIAGLQDEDYSWLDTFGMSPFHIFFSTPGPTMELLEVLLDSLPHHILKCKDANDRRPLEYLINNWTDGAKSLLQRTLQKSMIDRLARWGIASWTETMESKVQAILVEDDEEERSALCDEAYSALDHYENVQATSILEMALWKAKLKSGWTTDGRKRQALDREECCCLSGSHVVIPLIATFLGIQPASSEDD